MKKCNRCHLELSPDLFHVRRRSADGLARTCKDCVSEYGKSRYRDNPQYFSDLGRKWREENKERKARIDKAWKVANKEKVHSQERNRLHIRRAKIRSAMTDDPRLMNAEKVVYGYYGTLCMMPECAVNDPSLDHIIPFALGGRHEFGNLQVLCKFHNRSKQHRESIDYRPVELTDEDIDELVAI